MVVGLDVLERQAECRPAHVLAGRNGGRVEANRCHPDLGAAAVVGLGEIREAGGALPGIAVDRASIVDGQAVVPGRGECDPHQLGSFVALLKRGPASPGVGELASVVEPAEVIRCRLVTRGADQLHRALGLLKLGPLGAKLKAINEPSGENDG